MISLVTDRTAVRLPETSEAAIRIAATLRDYGTAPFWRLYVGEKGSVVAIVGETATLVAADDREDAALFLAMDPTVTYVRTDADTARLLCDDGFDEVRVGTTMRCLPFTATVSPKVRPLTPRQAYPLLHTTFGDALPPYDAWYADVSHRVRHGGCRIVGVVEGESPLSVAMTVAETDETLLVGGVATLPAFRKKGYASACVTALCAAGAAEKKTLWIAPESAELVRFYERLGFTPCGTWGEAIRKGYRS